MSATALAHVFGLALLVCADGDTREFARQLDALERARERAEISGTTCRLTRS